MVLAGLPFPFIRLFCRHLDATGLWPLLCYVREHNTEHIHFQTQEKNCQVQGMRTDITTSHS